MHRWLLLGAALALATACGGSQETPASEGEATSHMPPDAGAVATLNMNTVSFEAAGVPVIHKRTPGNATVSLAVFVDGGVAFSTPTQAGAERMAINVATSGGPASMDKTEYAARTEAMGSSIGGSFGYDYAMLSMSSIVPYFEATWDLFAATVRTPAWRESDVELTRERMLTGLRTELDDPDSAAGILAKELAFAGHAYEVRPQGREETVAALTSDDLRAVWSSLLVKDRLTIVVVGDVPSERVATLVELAFGDLPAAGVTPFERPSAGGLAFDEPALTVHPRPDMPTNYVLGYFAGPSVDDPDYPALQAALEILSDRLFEEVRTRRNLSYAVASGISDRRAVTGYLYVTAEQANTTLQVMFDTIDAMIDPGVGSQDLHDQIAGYLTSYYRGLQSNGAQAALLGEWELVGGGREAADRHLSRLQTVTSDDVARVLDTYVRNIRFVVIGDPDAVDMGLFTSR